MQVTSPEIVLEEQAQEGSMSNTINNFSIISLEEITFIAGTYKELTFEVLDESGNPVDIHNFTYNWVLSPFGKPDSVSLSKPGAFRTDCADKNRFTISLESYDTANLSGKFIQQPVVLVESEVPNVPHEFRLGQGYINILSAIGGTTITDTNSLLNQVNEISGSFANMNTAREMLSSNRIYYVRTDGNNSNDGLSNTAGGAFLTIQRALDIIVFYLDLRGYNITIQVGDGTYTTRVYLAKAWQGAGTITIQGNSIDPGLSVISVTNASAFQFDNVTENIIIKDLEIRTTTAGHSIYSTYGSKVSYNNVHFGDSAGFHLFAAYGGNIICSGNYHITGDSVVHWCGYSGGQIYCAGRTITFSGSIVCSSYFAYSTRMGLMNVELNTFVLSGSSTVTGVRYQVDANALIYTQTGGANYLPGNSAGGTSTGGQYV